jgi:integrase
VARAANRLSSRKVATLAEPGRHADGNGLYLVVEPSGAKRWAFLYRRDGKLKEMGLGGLAAVSLAEARESAIEIRRTLAGGGDPILLRKAQRTAEREPLTFGAFADKLVADLTPGFRNAKHAAQWGKTLKVYAAPLRPRRLDEITTDDVLDVLKPIWSTKAETASRLRGRIERVLDAAKAKGLRSGENPARWRGHLDHLLPKRQKLTRGHHAALPFDQVPAFVARLRERETVGRLAMEFLILSASRTGEVVAARWSELDLDAKVWTVPAERMKGARPHRVPLTPRMVEILGRLKPLRRGDFVFPGLKPGKPLSTGVFDAMLERLKVPVTAHGFRSSFRDWAGERTSFPREIAEAALAHVVGDDTEQAYRRGDSLEKRRKLMIAWADFVMRRAEKQGGSSWKAESSARA